MKAIYTRLSRDRSGLSTSTADQEMECREYLGGNDAEVYTDNDVSASTSKPRPAYERLLREVANGGVDEIVCWSTDRLYRRPLDLEGLIDLAESTGLRITALHSGLVDLSTPEGRAQARIGVAMNKAEVERLGDRVRRKKDSLAREGRPAGSRRPFGYASGGMAIADGEAEAIREAAGMVLNGASLMSVVRLWNGRGLRGSSGGLWTPNSVRRVLTSPRYAGRRVHRGKDVGRAEWPPILTRRDHQRLVRLFQDPSRRKGNPGPQYLLTGLVFCGVDGCGGRMSGRPNNGQPGYVCKRQRDAEGKEILHLGIKARPLEELVTRRASDLVLESPATVSDPSQLSAELLAERDQLETRLEALGTEFARGEISEHAFRGIDAELGRKIADVDSRLEATAQTVPTRTYLQHLEEPDDPEAFYTDPGTRAWLESLIEKVVVLPAERGTPPLPNGKRRPRNELLSREQLFERRVELHLRPGVRDHRDLT